MIIRWNRYGVSRSKSDSKVIEVVLVYLVIDFLLGHHHEDSRVHHKEVRSRAGGPSAVTKGSDDRREMGGRGITSIDEVSSFGTRNRVVAVPAAALASKSSGTWPQKYPHRIASSVRKVGRNETKKRRIFS